MKKLVLLGFAFAISSPALARPISEIKKSGELRICPVLYPGMLHAEPPDCKTNCKYSGPSYELPIAFAKTLKVKPVFKIISFDEQFYNNTGKTEREAEYTPTLLATGKCDLYSAHLTKIAWRESKIDFAILFPSRMMVVVNKANKAKFKKATDLSGAILAVEKDTSFHTWAQKTNESSLKENPIKIEISKPGDDLLAVEQGKADFALYDSDGALYTTKNKSKQLIAAFPVGSKDDIGWGVRKEDKDLKDALVKWIDIERKSETSSINTVWKKYFGMTLTNFVEFITSVE